VVIRVLYTIKGCIYEKIPPVPLAEGGGGGYQAALVCGKNTKKEGNVKEKGGKTKDRGKILC
jgi:hypothetical protein